jgi:hypothetical protein
MSKPRYATIKKVIETTIEKNWDKEEVSRVKFYTPEEWEQGRGETIGRGAMLTMIFEESEIYDCFNYISDKFVFQEKLIAALDKIGVYYEQGFGWSLHIYEG